MPKINEQLSAHAAKAFATYIEKLENEIEIEEWYGGGKYDWRVARVGDVGSDSWNMNMQEIDLELEKLRARNVRKTKTEELNRIKQLAGIAKPHVKALATKQAKRLPKKL